MYYTDDLHFTKKQEVSLYITAVSWTLLALISLFGYVVHVSSPPRHWLWHHTYAHHIGFALGSP